MTEKKILFVPRHETSLQKMSNIVRLVEEQDRCGRLNCQFLILLDQIFEKCSGHDLNIVDERHSYRQSRRPGIVGRFAPIGNFFSKRVHF